MISPEWLLFPALLYPLWEAAHVNLRDIELTCETLPPEWDGLTLLFLSDAHSTRLGRRERLLRQRLEGIDTDLLFYGGDIGIDLKGYRAFLEVTQGVNVRIGSYSIWGNSENLKKVRREELIRCLEDRGVTLLNNGNRVIQREDAPIALCGVDDPYSHKSDFAAAFEGIPDNTFRILLMHAPEGLLELGKRRADLILSGHTHGGQVRVPGLRAFHLHTHTNVDLDRGLYASDELKRFWPEANSHANMIVSVGIGTSTLPVRTFCPPEALRITLRSRT